MSNFALPQEGDVITVTTRRKNDVMGRSKWADVMYKNVQVIRPFKWTKPNEFCIPAENEPFINVRTISLNVVHNLVVHEGADPVDCTQGTHFVQVPGSKGNEYTVTVVDGFGTECECLGYTYRGQCKHLKIATEAVA